MGYIDKNLMKDEKIVYAAKVHWFIYAPPALTVLLGIWLVTTGPANVEGYKVIGTSMVIVGVFLILNAFIKRVTTELGVTTKRVIAKIGLIRRSTIELNHSKVESFIVNQSILGRLLGFGTIIIQGTGGGKTPIQGIDNPLEFRRKAMETIDAA